VISEARRAAAAFELTGAHDAITNAGSAEAIIDDDGLTVGDIGVAFVDADSLDTGNYRIELGLWPEGKLILTGLGRRFDTFARELRRSRNQARVRGMLAHGITTPETFSGALLRRSGNQAAEFQIYDTHITVVPDDRDPWQIPLGALTNVTPVDDPPAFMLESDAGLTTIGQLGRKRDECGRAITDRRDAQQQLLEEISGQPGFADGRGVRQGAIRDFATLLRRYCSSERATCANTLLEAATAEPRLGFVQLLDPDREGLLSPMLLPANWASFLLVPAGEFTVLEILAGVSAATYVFRADIEIVSRDLQLLHFRRAPLALTETQATLTPTNPHRLALRKLEPLRRLRAATVARVIHNDAWSASVRTAIVTPR
jgi:hypothetical protein